MEKSHGGRLMGSRWVIENPDGFCRLSRLECRTPSLTLAETFSMKTLTLLLSLPLFACGGASDPAATGETREAPPISMETADGGLRLVQKTGDGAGAVTHTAKPGSVLAGALAGAPDGAPAGALAEAMDGGPRFVTPEGWTEQAPDNRMRAKQYSLPGPEGSEPALAVVAYWPGGIGSPEMNLDRWVRQVGREGPAAALGADERWITETDAYLVTHVHVEGVIKPMEGMAKDIASTDAGAILAAFIEPVDSADNWTIKVTGPSKTVAAHKDRYIEFVNGL